MALPWNIQQIKNLLAKFPVSIANGGTGQTTAALARNALGLGNTTGPVPIANGGTGQTTVAPFRTTYMHIQTLTDPGAGATSGKEDGVLCVVYE